MNDRVLRVLLTILSFVPASTSFGHGTGSAPSAPLLPLKGTSIYQVDSKWTRQDGMSVPLSSLAGHPTVIAMVYISCPEACPMTVADLKKIEASIPESARSEVRVALFSFDSGRDTPEKLREFLKSKSVDVARWSAFHGSKVAVRKLAAVLGVRYKQDESGDFNHSNVITVIDQDGVIQHQQIGLKRDPKETAAKIVELTTKKR